MHPEGLIFPGKTSVTGRAPWTMHDISEISAGAQYLDFVLALSGDEQLLRRLNDMNGAETCYTKAKGTTDAKWKLDPGEVVKTLWQFASVL
jgi:hypothetical protein